MHNFANDITNLQQFKEDSLMQLSFFATTNFQKRFRVLMRILKTNKRGRTAPHSPLYI